MKKSLHGKPLLVIDEDTLRQIIEETLQSIPLQTAEKEWLNLNEVMEMTSLRSKSSIQKLRDSGELEITKPFKRVILYRRSSVLAFLEKHARKTF